MTPSTRYKGFQHSQSMMEVWTPRKTWQWVSPDITHCRVQTLHLSSSEERTPSRSTASHQGTRTSLGFGTLLPGWVSNWWRQWVSGPKNILESYPGQDPETKAKAVVGHKVFTKTAAQPPLLRPFHNIKPSRGKLFVREEWSWHSEG